MQNKQIVVGVVAVIVVACLSFWAGMSYGQSKNLATSANRQGFNQNGLSQNGGRGMRTGSGFVSGSVLSKDDKSLTVELRGGNQGQGGAVAQTGGSKIVLFSSATTVDKTISGAIGDISVGSQVSITGTTNPDGSVNATSIQIRPTMALPKSN